VRAGAKDVERTSRGIAEFLGHVGVHHGRLDIGVPQVFLDLPDIHTVQKKMRGEAAIGTTGKGVSNEYTENEWYDLLMRSDRMESLIRDHWTVMGETDRDHRIKLIVDEWGAWHNQDPNVPPAYLYDYAGTLRDAFPPAQFAPAYAVAAHGGAGRAQALTCDNGVARLRSAAGASTTRGAG
jgi:hypothetical protein